MCAVSNSASCSPQRRSSPCCFQLLLQPRPDALAHLRRRGIRECHHQDFIQGRRWLLLQQTAQAPLDERVRLARAGSGHDQDVATRRDRLLLGCG